MFVSISTSAQWRELKTQAQSHSVISLGEIGHGYESINAAKASTFTFLHREANYKAIIFECSFTECISSYLHNDAFENRIKNFVYPFWITPSVQASLQPVYEQEQNEYIPLITGCDIQEDCRFTQLTSTLIDLKLAERSIPKLKECDSILSFYIGVKPSRRGAMPSNEYNILIKNYDLIAEEINHNELPDIRKKLLQRSIANRKWLCQYLTIAGINARMHFRDSLMADNIRWLKDELFKEKKIAIWSADFHIAKPWKKNRSEWMGEKLAAIFGNEYYAISFQKGSHPRAMELGNGNSIQFTSSNTDKFDAVIYTGKLRKIENEQWETACN